MRTQSPKSHYANSCRVCPCPVRPRQGLGVKSGSAHRDQSHRDASESRTSGFKELIHGAVPPPCLEEALGVVEKLELLHANHRILAQDIQRCLI